MVLSVERASVCVRPGQLLGGDHPAQWPQDAAVNLPAVGNTCTTLFSQIRYKITMHIAH